MNAYICVKSKNCEPHIFPNIWKHSLITSSIEAQNQRSTLVLGRNCRTPLVCRAKSGLAPIGILKCRLDGRRRPRGGGQACDALIEADRCLGVFRRGRHRADSDRVR